MKASTGFALIPAMLYLISLGVLELEAHAAGGVPLWTNYYGQTGIAVDMAVDRSGNALVTGFDYETIFPDLITIKYSSDGLPLWTNRYNGPGSSDDQPKALAIDDTGNVFVLGTTGILGEPGDYLTLAYSGDGAPLWMNRYNGTGNNRDSARAVAVDSSGNLVVTIKYSSSLHPYLQLQRDENQIILSWTNSAFTLQSAPLITGVFTNVPGAASRFTNLTSSSQQFFRLSNP